LRIESRLRSFGKHAPESDLICRIATSLIFIVGGLGHFGEHQYMLDRRAASPWVDFVNSIGEASVLLWIRGAVFVIAGMTLSVGYKTTLEALALFVTLVRVTLAIHAARGHMRPFFETIAILGALIHSFLTGLLAARWLNKTNH